MRTADFDYQLPPELIAQRPAAQRDASRLLVLRRDAGHLEHRQFSELLDYLRAGDILVLNNSKVIPARLRGINARTRGHFEILLLEENAVNDWWVMLRPGKRARVGTHITLLNREGTPTHTQAIVSATNAEGHRRLLFDETQNISAALLEWGEVPLPPYIVRSNPRELVEDQERYQTVFAEHAGSVAAPTAGLHFTKSLLEKIRARGVSVQFITLHVGLGTFAPVKTEMLDAHTMHEERYEVSDVTARAVNDAKNQRRRVIAVGTTSVRVLESIAAQHNGGIVAGGGRTRMFIHPSFEFRIVDALLTNFHLPCSTLLMLVSAFAAPGRVSGRETILSAYAEAIRQRYRFFSYGDAMLIL
ncbi:MAG: tRNA preQ1(34) S-adenosylmethionine ribosyltransferase-isomerase QueA [Verrucomicrobia bacterium]|nr:tRNA preQ1(34) S-adenosylmethionine ribosyltransferase-isomerase QueA [Verrucomicrobiota bacterium]